jgi:hypothetical protein
MVMGCCSGFLKRYAAHAEAIDTLRMPSLKNSALMKQLRYKAVEQKRSDEAPAQQGGRAKYALLAATYPRRSGWQDGEWVALFPFCQRQGSAFHALPARC